MLHLAAAASVAAADAADNDANVAASGLLSYSSLDAYINVLSVVFVMSNQCIYQEYS